MDYGKYQYILVMSTENTLGLHLGDCICDSRTVYVDGRWTLPLHCRLHIKLYRYLLKLGDTSSYWFLWTSCSLTQLPKVEIYNPENGGRFIWQKVMLWFPTSECDHFIVLLTGAGKSSISEITGYHLQGLAGRGNSEKWHHIVWCVCENLGRFTHL